MYKKHNSHHIFLFLGFLILLFILIFGIRHFASEYTYSKDGIEIDNSQSYDDSLYSLNPFMYATEENRESEQKIIPMTDTSIENYVPGEENL
jgi:hypothetical protein